MRPPKFFSLTFRPHSPLAPPLVCQAHWTIVVHLALQRILASKETGPGPKGPAQPIRQSRKEANSRGLLSTCRGGLVVRFNRGSRLIRRLVKFNSKPLRHLFRDVDHRLVVLIHVQEGLRTHHNV